MPKPMLAAETIKQLYRLAHDLLDAIQDADPDYAKHIEERAAIEAEDCELVLMATKDIHLWP